jgi:hypothetical protein
VVVRDDPSRLFKSIRPNDDTSRFGVRTGFWASIGIGAIAFLWLTGHVGETLGFARALGAPELMTSNDHGLVAGMRMTLAAPLRIFEMALADPMRLPIAFILIAIPAAGLSVSRPRAPGGPKTSKLALTFGWMGFVTACLMWALLVTWVVLPLRRAPLAAIPLIRADFALWSVDLAASAGLDAFAFVSSMLWLVLLFRLPVPRLAIAFASAGGFLATFVTWNGFAISSGIADGVRLVRPTITTFNADHQTSTNLLVGTIQGRTTVLTNGESPALMGIPAPEFLVEGRSSMSAWMQAQPTSIAP